MLTVNEQEAEHGTYKFS